MELCIELILSTKARPFLYEMVDVKSLCCCPGTVLIDRHPSTVHHEVCMRETLQSIRVCQDCDLFLVQLAME